MPSEGRRGREFAALRRAIAAHERAVQLHEQAARLFERLGYPDRADAAHVAAERERERLRVAMAKLAEVERES